MSTICTMHFFLTTALSSSSSAHSQYHGAPLLFMDILSYMNLTFTMCFTVECVLKLISYGPGVNYRNTDILYCPAQ